MFRECVALAGMIGIAFAGEATGAGLRRLTHSQYNNAVRDLLQDQTRPADRFPPEDFVNGFKNQIQSQAVSPLLAEAYAKAAERLSRTAFRGGDVNHLVPCKPSGHRDNGCAAHFIRRFGRRAYRRQLTASESSRLMEVWNAQAAASRDFYKGTEAVVEAVLQSPRFLYRVEPASSSYGIASRLAFLLWDTIPDESLLEAAEQGELVSAEQVASMARRMASDVRARDFLNEFVAQWLRFDLLTGSVKDRRLYPQFTPELAAAMAEETRLLVHYLVWEDRNFLELFTAGYAFLNAELARVYGVPSPPAEFARVVFPPESDRAGFLGQGTFLALTGKPGDTSPTARGLFVRERLLCQHIPDPPPGTNANLPPVSPDQPRSNRERLAEHVLNPACAGCHQLIDPIGFALERYDTVGQHREKLHIKFMPRFGKENKSPKPSSAVVELDTRGRIVGMASAEFSSPRELGKILADNPRCQDCIVKQLFRFAAGRRESTRADGAAIRRIAHKFRGSGFRLREVIIATAVELARL